MPGPTLALLAGSPIPRRVDARSTQIVATLQDEHGVNAESEKMLEIDFAGGKPSVAGDQFGKGTKLSPT